MKLKPRIYRLRCIYQLRCLYQLRCIYQLRYQKKNQLQYRYLYYICYHDVTISTPRRHYFNPTTSLFQPHDVTTEPEAIGTPTEKTSAVNCSKCSTWTMQALIFVQFRRTYNNGGGATNVLKKGNVAWLVTS